MRTPCVVYSLAGEELWRGDLMECRARVTNACSRCHLGLVVRECDGELLSYPARAHGRLGRLMQLAREWTARRMEAAA